MRQGNKEKLDKIIVDVSKLEERAGEVSEQRTRLQDRQDGLRQSLDEQRVSYLGKTLPEFPS